MNRERILELANMIEADTEFPFEMSDCDRCFSGYTRKHFGMFLGEYVGAENADDYDLLIMPPGWSKEGRYSKAGALAVLRNFAETGRVDWSIAES